MKDGRPNPCLQGKQGIVAVGVAEEANRRFTKQIQHYTDGTSRDWCWGAHLDEESVDESGFVPRTLINKELGYAKGYFLRGIRPPGGGVRKLTAPQYGRLLRHFERS